MSFRDVLQKYDNPDTYKNEKALVIKDASPKALTDLIIPKSLEKTHSSIACIK